MLTDYNPPNYYHPTQVRQRPTGITLLAILNILAGGVILLMGLAMVLAISMVNDPTLLETLADSGLQEWMIDQLAILFGILGGVLLIMGALALLVSYGFLSGKRWSWFLAVSYGFLIIGLITTSTLITGGLVDILMLGVIIIIPVMIVVYLFRPNVKAWFSV